MTSISATTISIHTNPIPIIIPPPMPSPIIIIESCSRIGWLAHFLQTPEHSIRSSLLRRVGEGSRRLQRGFTQHHRAKRHPMVFGDEIHLRRFVASPRLRTAAYSRRWKHRSELFGSSLHSAALATRCPRCHKLKAVTKGTWNSDAHALAVAFWIATTLVPPVHQPLPVATMTSGPNSMDCRIGHTMSCS